MVNFEQLQQRGKENVDAVVASAGTLTKGVQAIATAYADYSKKSFEESKTYVEKLAGVKSIEKAVEIQAEYAKTAYELFMAETARIGETLQNPRQGNLPAAGRPGGQAGAASQLSSNRKFQFQDSTTQRPGLTRRAPVPHDAWPEIASRGS